MPRKRRYVVLLCVAALALAAFHPGGWTLDLASLEVEWILLPDTASQPVFPPLDAGFEDPASRLAGLAPRAPPSLV